MTPLAAADWGNVPEWVAAVGTSLAFAVALWVGIAEVRARRRMLADEAARQARLVLVGEPALVVNEQGTRRLSVLVTNHSDAPIYEVLLSIDVEAGEHSDRPQVEWVHMGPEDSATAELAVPEAPGQLTSGSPEVTFLDAAGRRWKRVAGFGAPTRLLDGLASGLTPIRLAELIEESKRKTGGDEIARRP